MSAPVPPGPAAPRPTSHRASSPAAQLIRKATPPLAAVTAVVAVVVILLVINGRPSASGGPAPGAVAEQPASTSSSLPTTPTPAPSRSSAPAAPPVSQPPATQPPATQPPATQASASTQAAKLPVTVLNNSRRQHLAAQVAAELAAKGWPIRKTGNFTGRIRATTIYYAPGQRAAAERLARQFGQIRRVEPRFRGLPGTGLTLVVTRDWSA